MTTFSEFLPKDRRAALAGGYPLSDRTSGAALFADISGFTPLTASLAEELGADRGAEVLTNQLNLVFGALIDQVHTYGGSVIGFSGDAITCWFGDDDGRRGTTAALAMQAVISDLDAADTAGGEETSIGIKVAVAAGSARRFLVGDAAVSFVEVLAGNTLNQTAAGEKLAKQGEVVVSSDVRESLGEDLDVLSESSDAEFLSFFVVGGLKNPAEPAPWPETVSLPDDVTRSWILPQVFQRLELGEGQFASELRQATAVFLRFSGIDYDGDDASGQKLNDFVCWIQSILERYGASLIQVTLGDKGSYLFMVFGAPVAHEDDTARALSAALEFRSPPAHLAFVSDIQIGVNRGLIHAGTYGGSASLTYGILGDATNVAARLMGQAEPGQILLPARLIKAAGKEFEFQQPGQIRMKGLVGPMSVTSLERRRASDGVRATSAVAAEERIIGRTAERAVATNSLREVAAGESRILIFEGEAGIGKSYLIADLLAQAQRLGFATLEGSGDAIEQSSPYFAWRRIMRAAFDVDAAVDSTGAKMNETVASRLQAIDPDLVRLAPLLSTIMAVDFPENDLTQAMSGEVRAENLNRLLAAVLSFRAASTPLVIVLDDAHWLDSASWSLAQVVARDVAPLLLIIGTRPPATPMPDYVYLRQLPASKVLSLELLSAQEIVMLSSHRLGVDQLPEPVANLILGKAEGLPFFGEELAYALRDAGHIRVEDGRAELVTSPAELERLTFPDTIQGVITSRIDRVTARQQLTLKVASVIGRIFTYQILSEIYPVDSSDQVLTGELVELEQLDITLLEKPDPELAYIFRHILVQEVTYGLLTFAQRKRLHRATAEWYEANQTAELGTIYSLLAYHWTVAEAAEKSIGYSLQAGRLALENGAFHEAIKHLTDGLDKNEAAHVITDARELAEWYYVKGVAHRNAGQIELSMVDLSTALDLLGQPYPTGQLRFSASLMGQVGRQIMHRIAPSYFDGRARQEDQALLIAAIYEVLQANVFFKNQAIAAVYCILRHLNLAEEALPSPQRARSYAAMVNAVGVAGLHKQVDTYLALAQEAVNEDELIRDQDLVFQYLAIYFAGAGRWEENEAYALRAAGIAEEMGNRRRWQENTSCLALALYSTGDIDRSARLRQQVYASAVKENDRQIQVWGLLEFAEIALLQGDLAQAAGYLEKAGGLGDDFGLTEAIWLNGLLGVTLHRLGRSNEARAAVDKAQAAISIATPSAFYLLEPLSGMAEVNMALWLGAPDDDELKKRAKQTSSLMKQFARSFPISKPRSMLWEGIFAWHDGSQAKATKNWSSGLESARELRMPYDEGLLLLELGAHGEEEASVRAQHLVEAREIFLALDAAYDLERLAALSR